MALPLDTKRRASTWSFPARWRDGLLLLFTACTATHFLQLAILGSLLRDGTIAPRDGAEGTRTPDLISAIDTLSHLSYSPTFNDSI